MFKNYLKIAFRTLWKHKTFSAINLIGLAISLAVCLLLITFIRHQQRFDHFHANADRIFRVITDIEGPLIGKTSLATTPGPLAEALRASLPHIESIVQMRRLGMKAHNQRTTLAFDGLYTEPSFLSVFDFPLIAGDAKSALVEPFSILLTESLAKTYFGSTDVVGEVLVRDNGDPYRITGVLHDVPAASHLQFQAVVSYSTLEVLDARNPGKLALNDWNIFTRTYTYILLGDEMSAASLQQSLNIIHGRFVPTEPNEFGDLADGFDVQALTNINLGRELANEIGQFMPGTTVYILSVLAALIMLIACFNYISLSVARSLKRAKEVGIRRVAGAWRQQLIAQFLTESVLTALLAMAAAWVLLLELIPAFNNLTFVRDMQAEITSEVLFDPWLYLAFLGFSILIGLLAGLFPALSLSAFLPVKVLKGLSQIRGFSALTFRRILIVVQFSLALIFIILTGFIYQQVNFMLQADYGFDRDHLVFVELQDMSYTQFRQKMMSHPSVQSVSAASAIPLGGQTFQRGKTAGMDNNLSICVLAIDEHFIDDLGLSLLAGRNFDPARATENQSIILSEKAVRDFGFASPQDAIGKVVILEETQPHTVAGVIKEFSFRKLSSAAPPLALRYDPGWFRYAAVRFHGMQLPDMLAHLRATWQDFAQAPPLRYVFFDEHLEAQYASMRDTIYILSLTSAFAILIACLGLLGMVIFGIETRTKEVGVRKILGAGVAGLVLLLSRSFVQLLVIAAVIAVPLCLLMTNVLLQHFSQRAPLSVGLFVWPVLALLVVAIVTIGSQTIRAALANPVNVLHRE